MVNELHAQYLAIAFDKVLGMPFEGNMAFSRCLESDILTSLCHNPQFHIPGWQVFCVSDKEIDDNRFITADRAVEIRESKKTATLLLIDTKGAGAGLDGIYSAVREINEKELFDIANKESLQHLRGYTDFVKTAVKKARNIGIATKNVISPWKEFDFYVHCAGNPSKIGQALAILGLWPIKIDNKPEKNDLDKSVRLVERLLLTTGVGNTPSVRIEGLMLRQSDSKEKKDKLEKFIRDTSGLHRNDIVLQLKKFPELWLNEIQPEIFNLSTLCKIEIVSWRNPREKLFAWSGLKESDEDDLPKFILNPSPVSSKDRTKLEIHWKIEPKDLKKGAVEYSASVIADADVLAEKRIIHTGKSEQKAAFTEEDFPEELEIGSKFEVYIQIQAIGNNNDIKPVDSDDFILIIGDKPPETPAQPGGKTFRSLGEAAVFIEESDKFLSLCHKKNLFRADNKDFISFREFGKKGKVYRPPLIRDVENDWIAKSDTIGRWWITVRSDGSRLGDLNYEPIEQGVCSDAIWKRLSDASRNLCSLANESGCGMIGLIHTSNSKVDEYINSWISALDGNEPLLALANTVEVKSLSGKTVGLIVLPHHPIRVAWHYAYDMLLYYSRYEDNMTGSQIEKICKKIDGSRFPFLLPGLKQGESFVFGDMLGFYAVAMVTDTDREPKAALSLMANALSLPVAPSVEESSADVLGTEILRYMSLHESYHTLKIHALRPGDGMTITRALGKVLSGVNKQSVNREEETEINQKNETAFVLDLYPSKEQTGITGKFISITTEKRRSGSSGLSSEDLWIQDAIIREGQITVPRLSWAKRSTEEPESSAHISVVFNAFESNAAVISREQLKKDCPLELHGLSLTLVRDFSSFPAPKWLTYIPISSSGEKHPAARILTERIEKIHHAIMRCVSRSLNGSDDGLPVLVTEIASEKEESLRKLHMLCDWVITLDRNVGIEYFDSPQAGNLSSVYDAFIIDCIPEREDLGLLQMITSTANIAEVQHLLESSLNEMGMSYSYRNCSFLIEQLKALSGRLAMRLSSPGVNPGELVALSLVYSNCLRNNSDHDTWLDLSEGFFVPLDDVRPLLLPVSKKESENMSRADLLYVTVPRRSGLEFKFVEVKYRRYLSIARNSDLTNDIIRQISATRDKWENYYINPQLKTLERSSNRQCLAKILRFYCNKAHRHHLKDSVYESLMKEIDKMLLEGAKYQFSSSDKPFGIGYIFCPEVESKTPIPVLKTDEISIHLFGQSQIPDSSARRTIMPQIKTENKPENKTDDITEENESNQSGPELSAPAKIVLGKNEQFDEEMEWVVNIRSNPHLMIVGKSGMGKTTALINICRQLYEQSVNPIIFSYHEDIDAKLKDYFSETNWVDYDGLGFNPLKIVTDSPRAYIDNAGMIRDIFASVFPDFGEIQLDNIRQAIKQSYQDLGWGRSEHNHNELSIPAFQAFYDILKTFPKSEKIIARFRELNDYDFFQQAKGDTDPFSIDKPSIIRIHQTQNELLQRAFANFILYHLYQSMFIRGEQKRITHAIIFDEAHRASRLKLLSTFVKECRKFGISLVMASQEIEDFNASLFANIANYLILRSSEKDAKILAKNVTDYDKVKTVADRIKQLPKYHAAFFSENRKRPVYLVLAG